MSWTFATDACLETIITAATETSDQTSKEKSASSLLQSALDNIIYGESKSRFERPTSVHSVMELILGIATGFFMKKYVSVQDPGHKNEHKGPLEIFRESIRDVVGGLRGPYTHWLVSLTLGRLTARQNSLALFSKV